MAAVPRPVLRQLPFWRALGIAISEAARRVFDRFGKVSYAEAGLDRQILSFIWDYPSKFYVDVGCNYPDKISNTYLLYQLGWTGLCIDANPSLVKRFRRARPKDTVECACVGEGSTEATFVICKNPGWSHVLEDVVHPHAGDEAHRIRVPVKSLQQLFEEHKVPRDIGLLSIDLEGFDLVALRSFDLRRWRPHLIVIEIHDGSFDFDQIEEHAVFGHLRSAGYRLAGFNGCDLLFLDAGMPD